MKYNFTKAETLQFLAAKLKKKKIKNLIIPKLIFFSKSYYLKNKNACYRKIKKVFGKKPVIIRSSSKDEDNEYKSNAGKYLSILNVKIDKEIIEKNIDKIIKKFKFPTDQIIIQEFLEKPNLSGVLFTREVNYNSPYYIINFDTSGKTNLITSGKNNPSMRIESVYREKIFLSKRFYSFLSIVKELEALLGSDRLDIEFAKKNSKWFLFQCRYLPRGYKANDDDEIRKTLVNLKKKIDKLKKTNPTIAGKTTHFSNMADWNPAEMIGDKPKPLAISLYSELITDSVWASQRKDYFYKDVSPNILMVNLAGSPFIDLRTDINSFLPKGLPKTIETKIVDNLLIKLKSKPYLHDKIEFDIIPTCYDFGLNNKSLSFLKNKEKKIYIKKLKELTNYVLSKKNNLLKKELKKIDLLDEKIKKINSSKISEIQKIFFLINDCKKYGTLPFAGAARLAFVCTIILRTLHDLKIINQKNIEDLYSSIPTITKKINQDFIKINKSKNKIKIFLKKYGHLRPLTYSITSPNYKEGFKTYFSATDKNYYSNKKNNFHLSESIHKKINRLFLKEKIELNSKNFFDLFKKSIEAREYAKFIFSKSINKIFENLIKLGKIINIPRNDLEFISIKKIISSYSVLETNKLSLILKKEVSSNKKSFNILRQIKFPDFIKSSSDIYLQSIKSSKGNFITNKKINGNVIYLNSLSLISKLNNKIILLENADPGYDFIFSHKIKGLITKYGGSNSHMTIRCLELNIPAIIGVGVNEFDQIKKCNLIEFDCEQKTFKSIS